jgi:hypothetical protein
MFGIIPGLITARLTGLLGGVLVGPFIMLFMVRYDRYRLPVRLAWSRAFLTSALSFLLLFGPLVLPRMTALLRLSFVRGTFLQLLPWAVAWFLLAFALVCLVVSVLLDISFQQAISWWGVAFTATVTMSWIMSLGLVLLYRFLLLPSVTDFF